MGNSQSGTYPNGVHYDKRRYHPHHPDPVSPPSLLPIRDEAASAWARRQPYTTGRAVGNRLGWLDDHGRQRQVYGHGWTHDLFMMPVPPMSPSMAMPTPLRMTTQVPPRMAAGSRDGPQPPARCVAGGIEDRAGTGGTRVCRDSPLSQLGRNGSSPLAGDFQRAVFGKAVGQQPDYAPGQGAEGGYRSAAAAPEARRNGMAWIQAGPTDLARPGAGILFRGTDGQERGAHRS